VYFSWCYSLQCANARLERRLNGVRDITDAKATTQPAEILGKTSGEDIITFSWLSTWKVLHHDKLLAGKHDKAKAKLLPFRGTLIVRTCNIEDQLREDDIKHH
jgi:hypothetical protein